MTCRDVGRVRSIILESNCMSSKPNWHLDMVVLEVSEARACWWVGGLSKCKCLPWTCTENVLHACPGPVLRMPHVLALDLY